jgi:hypothetical protein
VSENVVDINTFRSIRTLRDADRTTAEIHAEALGCLEVLTHVNLLELTPRSRQKAIKDMARFKAIAAVSSPAFTKILEDGMKALQRAHTEEEMYALLRESLG